MNYNRVIIGGRLTRDPELVTTAGNTQIAKLGVAVNRPYKNDEVTTYLDVKFFGQKAEAVNKFFAKGRPILIEGRLEQETWEDKDKIKRSKIVVIGDNFEFVDSSKK